MTTERAINWDLIQYYQSRPHRLLNYDPERFPDHAALPNGFAEIAVQARTVHHLLDLMEVPQEREGSHYAGDLDARAYQLVVETMDLRIRLDRIATWHSRETGEGGTVGDFCIACDQRWPCETRRMAAGTHEDLVEPEAAS